MSFNVVTGAFLQLFCLIRSCLVQCINMKMPLPSRHILSSACRFSQKLTQNSSCLLCPRHQQKPAHFPHTISCHLLAGSHRSSHRTLYVCHIRETQRNHGHFPLIISSHLLAGSPRRTHTGPSKVSQQVFAGFFARECARDGCSMKLYEAGGNEQKKKKKKRTQGARRTVRS